MDYPWIIYGLCAKLTDFEKAQIRYVGYLFYLAAKRSPDFGYWLIINSGLLTPDSRLLAIHHIQKGGHGFVHNNLP